MGDHVYVSLVVLAEHAEQVKQIATDNYHEPQDACQNDALMQFGFYDVNYGDLPFLDDLRNAGIPYQSSWDAGSDFGQGADYLRFTENGEAREANIFDEDLNPSLSELVKRIDDYAALRRYIEEHAQQVTILPWDNQAEWGLKYKTIQLITPPERK